MSSSAAAFPEAVTVPDSSNMLHVNMNNVTKLTVTNFLMWSRQVHALLDGYDLAGYLDGSIAAPAAQVTTNGVSNVNPAYTQWKRQDKLIYSALLGAITISIQPILAKANTSAQIWETLSLTYAKPSRGHVKQLKQQIKQWTKGTKSINEYFQGFTTRFDQLALLGKPIEHEDQIEFILEGLSDDYKQVVEQIEGRDSPPSLTEVHEKLINHELKLQALVTQSSSLPISANVAQTRGNNHHQNRNNNNNYRGYNQPQHRQTSSNNQTWQQQNFQPRSDQFAPRGYQGRCQICGVHGYSAKRYSQYLTSGGSNNTNQRPYSPTPWQPRANMTVASPYNPNNWVLDSGATHHLTSDLNNMSLHQPYTGGEDVAIADGSTLPISHTGEGSQHGGAITPRSN